MRFYLDRETDPAFNLALEEILAAEGDAPEFFMLWRNRPTVVIGRNQLTAAEIDGGFLRARGIDLVRRITGGGAVYHDLGNVNYTIAAPGGAGEADSFAHRAAPVVDVLREWGIDARFSGRNDILVGDRKVSGSARSALRGRILFHGTLLFDVEMEALAGALKPDPLKTASKGIASVRARVANLKEFLPGLTAEEFMAELARRLCRRLGVPGESPIPAAAVAAARRLAAEKYRSDAWTYGNSFDYDYEKRARFPGGTLSLRCRVEGNRIAAASITGDFFGVRPAAELEARLVGAGFRRDAVAAVLPAEIGEFIGGVTREEFLSLFE